MLQNSPRGESRDDRGGTPTTQPVELPSCVPDWHPEGGTMAARLAALQQESDSVPMHYGMIVATALLLVGLAVLQAHIDAWFGAAALAAGVLLLVRCMWRVRHDGGVVAVDDLIANDED